MKSRFFQGTALLTAVLLGGCSRISHSDGITGQTRPDAAPVLTDAPNESFTAGANDPYEHVAQYYLDEYNAVSEEDKQIYSYQNCYALYDLDKDGTLELIIRLGFCEGDYQFYVWTLDADGNPVQIDGSAGGSHTGLYGSNTETGFYVNSCHMGNQHIQKYDMTEGNTLSETEIYGGGLVGDAQNLYGYYDLTSGQGFFRIVEKYITEYTFEESEHVVDATEPMTLEEYIAGLEAVKAAEDMAVG